MIPRPYFTKEGILWVRDVDTPKGKMRVMQHQGVYQSASFVDERRFDPPFAYLVLFDHVFELGCGVSAGVLMIGGGGYSWPKHVLASRPDVSLDVVEFDPAFTRAARKHLFLDEALKKAGDSDRLQVHHDDGLAYLMGTEQRYAAIVNDAFVGEVPDQALMAEEGLEQIRRHLVEGGAYFVNVVADQGTAAYDDALHCVGRAFVHTYVIDARDVELSDVDNYLVVGSDVEQPFTEVLEHRVRLL